MKKFYIVELDGKVAWFGTIKDRNEYLRQNPDARKATNNERKRATRHHKMLMSAREEY